MTSKKNRHFSEQIIQWHRKWGRKDLPWQQNPTSYRVWLSEIMLQQTQVNTVIPYFERFMNRFPDIATLAQATQEEVLALWAGLGYYARARNLHKTALILLSKYEGQFPQDIKTVYGLPGIGRSTAGAILSLSQDQSHAILDGNVKRVLARHFSISGWPGLPQIEKKLWEISEALTPQNSVAQYNQAMMDLGATLCTRTKPRCQDCPIQTSCLAFQQGTVENFPHKKPSSIKPHRTHFAFIFLHNNKILLEKRPNRGIWGGLWSLPEIQTSKTIKSFKTLANTMRDVVGQFAIKECSALKSIEHSFTHFDLTLKPILCQIQAPIKITNSAYQWHTLHTLKSIGLPAPIQKLLNSLENTSVSFTTAKNVQSSNQSKRQIVYE